MKTVALAGGVGAAKLLSGLACILPGEDLTIIVNTGDDFEWMGLTICPDLDTVTYTLAGLANPDTGWGIAGDTFHLLERLARLGVEPWFMLGDRDLATHVYRTEQLRQGRSLSQVTRSLCDRNGVRARILPMTDERAPTKVRTEEGVLEFQDYFVRRRCAPRVRGFVLEGAEKATAAPGVLESVASAEIVILCPSNPFISIGPILAVSGLRAALRECAAPVLAVSPVIGRRAVKGPTAAMLEQLGMEVSARSVAGLYQDMLDIFVLDECDRELAGEIERSGIRVTTARTLMDSPGARTLLAEVVLQALIHWKGE